MKKVFVLEIASPFLVGIYDADYNLIFSYSKDGFVSDILAEIFVDILEKYKIDELYYVNAPGSFMAIKVSFVFLRTISITNNIPLFATDGFYFNNNSPIKAIGKKVFIKNEQNEIVLQNLDTNYEVAKFELPQKLNKEKFTNENSPNYYLPAV